MFCHKCGDQSLEGAEFCSKCGSKLIVDEAAPQMPDTPVPAAVPAPAESPPQAAVAPAPIVPPPQEPMPHTEHTQSSTSKKKKPKKLFIIVGAALVATIIIAVALLSGNGGSGGGQRDLFQIASSVSPMTEFGFDATYGDLFGWLMSNRRTNLDQQGDVAYLTFSGNVTGGDYPVSIVLRMTGLSQNTPNQRLEPHAMTLNAIAIPDFNNPEGALMDLFWAHQNRGDYRTFMDFANWDNEYGMGTFSAFVGGGTPLTQQQAPAQQQAPTGNLSPLEQQLVGGVWVGDDWGGVGYEFFPDGTGVLVDSGPADRTTEFEWWIEGATLHIDEELGWTSAIKLYEIEIIGDRMYLSYHATGSWYLTTANLNLREWATTESDIIELIPEGTPVLRFDNSGDWFQVIVEYGGEILFGWMLSEHLEFSHTETVLWDPLPFIRG